MVCCLRRMGVKEVLNGMVLVTLQGVVSVSGYYYYRCSSYRDSYNNYHSAFTCSRYSYCCKKTSLPQLRYCCSSILYRCLTCGTQLTSSSGTTYTGVKTVVSLPRIIGGVIGGFVLIGLIIILVCCLKKNSLLRNGRMIHANTQQVGGGATVMTTTTYATNTGYNQPVHRAACAPARPAYGQAPQQGGPPPPAPYQRHPPPAPYQRHPPTAPYQGHPPPVQQLPGQPQPYPPPPTQYPPPQVPPQGAPQPNAGPIKSEGPPPDGAPGQVVAQPPPSYESAVDQKKY